ncbi:MAG TPA: cache domain-containing protein [Burkholderiaceae bacterium]|nr:cache domain-containing protein [Burkholderiaceae bacterium]
MFKIVRIALITIAFGLLQSSAWAAQATKADAEGIVEKAATFAAKNGPDKLVSEVNKKDGPFHQGELYVFVFDKTGTVVAHPVNPALVGKNQVSEPDADGKLFRKEILEVAQTKGSGWVDYKYKNPVTGAIEAKTSYVKKQGDLIIAAGAYQK